MTINLNDQATVRLTQLGADIANINERFSPPARRRVWRAGEEMKTQLHELFLVFGIHCTVGFQSQVFEGNEIVLSTWQTPVGRPAAKEAA